MLILSHSALQSDNDYILSVFCVQIHEVKLIAGILHTIVFHRALGLVRPKDIDLELFEITYVQCGDVELEKKIEEKIDQFISWVEKHPNKKSQICLSFYETKNKHPSWFNKTERLFWEHWYVNLHVTQHTKAHSGKSHHSKPMVVLGETVSEERGVRKEALEASLHEFIGFSFWDGCVQEDATDRTSNHAQLIIIVGHLNCFVDYFECQQFNYSDFLVRDPKASSNFTVHFEQFGTSNA
ncbi:hypothetical protein D5086_014752 [Populus alba]|uniref:Uncharacterized protein n=1 Tax=Populus alba TaxID=43335 RepID=A0ACC4BZ37_POPAL